jgi:hypothetical protein
LVTSEDTPTALNGLSVTDVDASTGNITATLTVLQGTLTAQTVAGVTLAGNGTASVQLSGTTAAINALLATAGGVSYTPAAHYNGTDKLTLFTSDGSNTGSGGTLTDTDTMAITVNAVNDAPVNSVPGAQSTNEDTAKVITGLAIADADADAGTGTGTLTVTLAVTQGTLAVSGGTATIANSGTGTVTLTGTLTQINATLSASNAVTYTPALNYNGVDTLTMTTHDGGNTGGAAQSAISTVAFSIAAINDAPVLADTILSLTAVAQNSPNPAGAVGNTVASLLGGASDVDASALQGIAITGVNANGKLWYSTDGGTSWTENSTALSAGNALLLTADADNRVYFAPNADFEGIVSDALSFRAWDQTSGTQGSFVSTTTNGTTTAFSSFIDTVSQSVGRTLTIDTVSVDNLLAINEAIQLTGTAAAGALGALHHGA